MLESTGWKAEAKVTARSTFAFSGRRRTNNPLMFSSTGFNSSWKKQHNEVPLQTFDIAA
jgi:hypothetical protein